MQKGIKIKINYLLVYYIIKRYQIENHIIKQRKPQHFNWKNNNTKRKIK